MKKRGYVLIVLTALIFSSSEAVLKTATLSLAPMQITAERIIIGTVIFSPFAAYQKKKKKIRLCKEDVKKFLRMSFCTAFLNMTLYQFALITEDASAVGIIYSAAPVASAYIASFFFHERIGKNYIVAITLEVIGILIILNPFSLEMSLIGLLEVIAAMVLNASYFSMSKQLTPKYGSILTSFYNMAFGSTEFLVVLLLGKISSIAEVYRTIGLELFAEITLFGEHSTQSIIILMYMGVIVCAGGFFLLAKITEYTSSVEASFVYLLKPALATILAAYVLQERISVNRWAGMLLFIIAAGFAIFPTRSNKRA